MRGIGFIGMIVTMLIVAYLMIKNLKSSSHTALQNSTEMQMPANITQLPATVKQKLNEDMKNAEENNKKAMEGIEK